MRGRKSLCNALSDVLATRAGGSDAATGVQLAYRPMTDGDAQDDDDACDESGGHTNTGRTLEEADWLWPRPQRGADVSDGMMGLGVAEAVDEMTTSARRIVHSMQSLKYH